MTAAIAAWNGVVISALAMSENPLAAIATVVPDDETIGATARPARIAATTQARIGRTGRGADRRPPGGGDGADAAGGERRPPAMADQPKRAPQRLAPLAALQQQRRHRHRP